MDIVAGVASTTMAISHVKDHKGACQAAQTRGGNNYTTIRLTLDEMTAEFGRNIDDIAQVEGGTVSSSEALLALLGEFDKKDGQKAFTGIPLLDQALGWQCRAGGYMWSARDPQREKRHSPSARRLIPMH